MILILFLSVAVVAAPDCSLLDGDWLVATVHTWNSPPKLRPIII
jgi:hypothetical protein